MATTEKRVVYVSDASREPLPRAMTRAQAHSWGERHMPADLKRAGFQTCVFASDEQIHGSLYFRVSYGMQVGTRTGA